MPNEEHGLLGISVSGTPRKSSFIINQMTNQTTMESHKSIANLA